MGILGQAVIHYIIGVCLWAPPENTRTLTGSARPPRWGRLFLGVRGACIAYRTICLRAQSALQSRMPAARRQKITLAEMRASGFAVSLSTALILLALDDHDLRRSMAG